MYRIATRNVHTADLVDAGHAVYTDYEQACAVVRDLGSILEMLGMNVEPPMAEWDAHVGYDGFFVKFPNEIGKDVNVSVELI